MGEAKRRKKLDPNYGKIRFLKTLGQQQKHCEQFVSDVYFKCEPQIKFLIKAEKIPDNYQQIRAQISEWIEKRLSKYCESDRETLALALSAFFLKTWQDDETSDAPAHPVLQQLCVIAAATAGACPSVTGRR